MNDEVKIIRKEQSLLTTFDDIEGLNAAEYDGFYPEGYYDSPRNNYLQLNLDQNTRLFEENTELRFEQLHRLVDVYGRPFALIPSDQCVIDVK
jgi:hypothetical protein